MMKWIMMIRTVVITYKNLKIKIIKCSLYLNIHLTFGFHIVVS